MQVEAALLQGAAVLYLLAFGVAAAAAIAGRGRDRAVLGLVAAALAAHAASVGIRWVRLDHGPYVDLFEILSSNVLSLHLILLLLCLAFPVLRAGLAMALAVLSILVLWMLAAPMRDTTAPVTYETIWLPIHMVLGKIFLGLVATAVGLSLVVLARRVLGCRIAQAPSCAVIEELAYRLMLVAAVFQTLMLVAGAAWARDAWGRYWAWDPLESWAFLTWLAMLAYLHWRPRHRAMPAAGAAMVVATYVIAFATFFGVPFLSMAPHKGAV